MSDIEYNYEIPIRINKYFIQLSKIYIFEDEKLKLEIIANSKISIQEGTSYENWNGGTTGHSVYLTLPESLYLRINKQKDNIQKQITTDINKINNVCNEFVNEVFFEMEIDEEQDWRRDTGLLLSKRSVSFKTEKRIWGDNKFKVFLSHKSNDKVNAANLKEKLKIFGISCFVAHEDIQPTKQWQDEIENALFTMDAFIALMTENFHDSNWTDQEVGVAFGRGVPIVCLRLGTDPLYR